MQVLRGGLLGSSEGGVRTRRIGHQRDQTRR